MILYKCTFTTKKFALENKALTVERGHGWKHSDQEEDGEAHFQSDEGLLNVEDDQWKKYRQLTNCCRTNPKPEDLKKLFR